MTIQDTLKSKKVTNITKRCFDVLACLAGMILLFPIFVLIAVAIKRDTPGSIFYRGPRMGRGGRIFLIYKFRTMYEDASSREGLRITAQDDPRITPFGRWLRDTKLNELPQLMNVLKGDMSLVGPRPEDPQIAAAWPEDVRSEVLSVRPGVTSPASVQYRNEEGLLNHKDVMDVYMHEMVPSKLRLDQLYVRHHSFLLDLDVLFWTFLVLLPRLKTYSPSEPLLFLGPVSQFVRRYFTWFSVDFIITFIAMGIAGLIFRSIRPLDLGLPLAIISTAGFAAIFSMVGALFGVQRTSWSRAGLQEVYDLVASTFLAMLISLLANNYLPRSPRLPNAMILAAGTLAFAGFIAVRYRSRILRGLAIRWLTLRQDANGTHERVLIVGSGESGQFSAWLLGQRNSPSAFRVVGFVDDDLYKQGSRIRGLNVIGRSEDIPALVTEYDIGLIIFAIHNIDYKQRQRLLEICSDTPARLVDVPDVLGRIKQMIESPIHDDSRPMNGKRKYPAPEPLSSKLISSDQIDAWLGELLEISETGNLAALQNQIHAFRGQLQSDISYQISETLQKGRY
jgi:lipopolysaccharide/colanic/teichoic acid biosynthesis glycosyltransferase